MTLFFDDLFSSGNTVKTISFITHYYCNRSLINQKHFIKVFFYPFPKKTIAKIMNYLIHNKVLIPLHHDFYYTKNIVLHDKNIRYLELKSVTNYPLHFNILTRIDKGSKKKYMRPDYELDNDSWVTL
jgi:hypothetical protein